MDNNNATIHDVNDERLNRLGRQGSIRTIGNLTESRIGEREEPVVNNSFVNDDDDVFQHFQDDQTVLNNDERIAPPAVAD